MSIIPSFYKLNSNSLLRFVKKTTMIANDSAYTNQNDSSYNSGNYSISHNTADYNSHTSAKTESIQLEDVKDEETWEAYEEIRLLCAVFNVKDKIKENNNINHNNTNTISVPYISLSILTRNVFHIQDYINNYIKERLEKYEIKYNNKTQAKTILMFLRLYYDKIKNTTNPNNTNNSNLSSFLSFEYEIIRILLPIYKKINLFSYREDQDENIEYTDKQLEIIEKNEKNIFSDELKVLCTGYYNDYLIKSRPKAKFISMKFFYANQAFKEIESRDFKADKFEAYNKQSFQVYIFMSKRNKLIFKFETICDILSGVFYFRLNLSHVVIYNEADNIFPVHVLALLQFILYELIKNINNRNNGWLNKINTNLEEIYTDKTIKCLIIDNISCIVSTDNKDEYDEENNTNTNFNNNKETETEENLNFNISNHSSTLICPYSMFESIIIDQIVKSRRINNKPRNYISNNKINSYNKIKKKKVVYQKIIYLYSRKFVKKIINWIIGSNDDDNNNNTVIEALQCLLGSILVKEEDNKNTSTYSNKNSSSIRNYKINLFETSIVDNKNNKNKMNVN